MRKMPRTMLLAALVAGYLVGCAHSAPPKSSTPATAAATNQAAVSAAPAKPMNPLILITTSEGTIKIELWPDKAPATEEPAKQ